MNELIVTAFFTIAIITGFVICYTFYIFCKYNIQNKLPKKSDFVYGDEMTDEEYAAYVKVRHYYSTKIFGNILVRLDKIEKRLDENI